MYNYNKMKYARAKIPIGERTMKNTTLIYIEKDGKTLLLHRTKKKNDLNHDLWVGIGGHCEEGESPEDCALREAKEETGLTLTEPFSGTPAARLVRYSDYTTLLCLRQCIIGLDHLKIFFPNLAHAEQIHGAFVRHGDAFCIGRHIAGGFLPPGREVRGHNGV